MDIGTKIRQAIKAEMDHKDLDQEDVAKLLGVKQPSVSAIMTGKRGILPQSLLDLLDVLGLELTVQKKQEGTAERAE